MFISYFEPFRTRNEEAFDLNFFYKQLYSFKNEDVLYITNEFYFKPVEYYIEHKSFLKGERLNTTLKYYQYELPTNDQLNTISKYLISDDLFYELKQKYNNDITQIEKFLLTEVFEPLYEKFDFIIDNLKKKHKNIECIFVIKNCPSIEKVAQKYNIPVVHYEIATFRNPMYVQTGYFDFRGVNGYTECEKRYNRFKKEINNHRVNILSKKELLNLLRINYDYFLNKKIKHPKYKVGVAGQVYNDSNLIAYSNGYDSEKLLGITLKYFKEKDIIVRNHPGNPPEKFFKFKNIDTSSSAAEFIQKCKSIITINSSVGLEAILFNKSVFILGDSPFKFLSKEISKFNNDKKVVEELLKLNFFIFGYLVPFKYLFAPEYIRWRLTFPDECAIYEKNFEFYKELKKMNKIEIENYLKQLSISANNVLMKDMYLWSNTPIGESNQEIIKQRTGATDFDEKNTNSRTYKIIKEINNLLKSKKINNDATLLDITCSDEIVISKIKKMFQYLNVYGIDCAIEEFNINNEVKNSGVHLYKGYIQHLFRYKPNIKFDIVIMLNSYRGWNSAKFNEKDKDIPELADKWFEENARFIIVTATEEQIKKLRTIFNVKILGRGESNSIMILLSKEKIFTNFFDKLINTLNYRKVKKEIKKGVYL